LAPDWVLGAFLGAGGFAGSYLGARLQRHLPERTLRRLLGLIACLVAVRYVQTSINRHRAPGPPTSRPPDDTIVQVAGVRQGLGRTVTDAIVVR
jgi:Sulfite exporter TauE/SafE